MCLTGVQGGYDETPEVTASFLAEFAAAGLVNLIGGCCGTTKEHIRAIRKATEHLKPRQASQSFPPTLVLSGNHLVNCDELT